MPFQKVLIIAEAGVNHNGDIKNAKKLIEAAADAGADIVKFQTFKAENLVTKTAIKAHYQIESTQKSESQFQMLKQLELNLDDFLELKNHCETFKIRFLSTGFDNESNQALVSLNNGLWKIPSGEITNLPYLEFIGSLGQKIILSTGMSDLSEIEAALDILTHAGTPLSSITVLQCNTEYPTPMSDVNLNAMATIRNKFQVDVGYSDHTDGIEISLAAVALGATIIEKHFTLDKSMAGPDHAASLTPIELKALVKGIRNIELALGSTEKKPSPSEEKNRNIVRKSIVAKTPIKMGDILTKDNITTKRPGTGLSPMLYNKMLGTKASSNFLPDEFIK